MGANTLTPSFVPDVLGAYTLQFAFTDDAGSCAGGNQLSVAQVVTTASGFMESTQRPGRDLNVTLRDPA